MEWKPIETAPQDGTWMLLYFAGPQYYKIAFWSCVGSYPTFSIAKV